jgi:hypothetical protein
LARHPVLTEAAVTAAQPVALEVAVPSKHIVLDEELKMKVAVR